MWKSDPARIRTHDPLDQPDIAKRTIYSSIISFKKLQTFIPHSQMRRAINMIITDQKSALQRSP